MPGGRPKSLTFSKKELLEAGLAAGTLDYLERLNQTLRAIGFGLYVARTRKYTSRRCIVCQEYYIPYRHNSRNCSPECRKIYDRNRYKYKRLERLREESAGQCV